MAPRRILSVFTAAAVIIDHTSGVSFFAHKQYVVGKPYGIKTGSLAADGEIHEFGNGFARKRCSKPETDFFAHSHPSSDSLVSFKKFRTLLTML